MGRGTAGTRLRRRPPGNEMSIVSIDRRLSRFCTPVPHLADLHGIAEAAAACHWISLAALLPNPTILDPSFPVQLSRQDRGLSALLLWAMCVVVVLLFLAFLCRWIGCTPGSQREFVTSEL